MSEPRKVSSIIMTSPQVPSDDVIMSRHDANVLADKLREYRAENERLQAECAAMREALLKAAKNGFDGMYAACPLCNERIEAVGGFQIHKPDCTIGNALSLNAGAQSLERYKAMERLYKAVKVTEDIRSEVLPLLASDEEQAAWVTEWESRLHPADDEVEAALEALEAMDHAQ